LPTKRHLLDSPPRTFEKLAEKLIHLLLARDGQQLRRQLHFLDFIQRAFDFAAEIFARFELNDSASGSAGELVLRQEFMIVHRVAFLLAGCMPRRYPGGASDADEDDAPTTPIPPSAARTPARPGAGGSAGLEQPRHVGLRGGDDRGPSRGLRIAGGRACAAF